MTEHFPVLLIIVPFLAAPLSLLLRNGRVSFGLAVAATWAALWMAVQVLFRVLEQGTISYHIGGWEPPWGIEYRVDYLNAFVLVLVALIGAIASPYMGKSVAQEIAKEKLPAFYTAFLLCFTGLLGITVTGDAFNVFVFLEVSSLSAYALIAMGRDRRALTASFRYLIMGSVGATFIVIGIGLMYAMTGTLNMADLAERLPAVSDTRTIRAAFAFLTIGTCLKLALFPLHLWLPNAYTYAPSAVTSFVAATATKVAVYMLLRFFFTIFGPGFSFEVVQLDWVLLPLALVAIVSMSLVAVFQQNVKRSLAYSSVAQIGYMILGISLVSVAGLTGGIVHLFNHALMKAALFMAVGCVMYRVGSVSLSDWAGLGRRMPWTMGAFVGAGLSIIGVPATVGFISKWYLIVGALEKGWWPVAALVLGSSLLALVYIWRVVEVAYLQPAPQGREGRAEAPLSLLIPTWILVLLNFYFGINARLTAGVAADAARWLLGGGS
ncbi:MAG: monovalent cation/H+ antiporter subunit D family protein [Gemmatimonadota bacterium]